MEEYPTEEELLKIEKWDFEKDGSISEFLDFLRSLWHWEEYFSLKGKRTLEFELHTGGWSGNEEIIDALSKNFIFWSMCWQKSTRGGNYYFKTKLKLWK